MANTTRPQSSSSSSSSIAQLQLGFDLFALVVGGLGNGLVMTVILNKNQKNVNDVFIINLAIADVMFILLSIPGDVMAVINKPPNSVFYCATVRPLVTMFFCLGLFTITAMAIYRCHVIVNPYRPKMKFRYAYVWILIAWILSLLTALPAIIVATVSLRGFCTGKWKSRKYKDAYIIFLLLAKCIIPLLLISISYTKLGVFLHQNQPPQTPSLNRASKQKRNRIENIRIVKTVAAIVVLFAICTTPHQAGWSMFQFGDKEQKDKGKAILRISPIIQNLHTCVNPLIYAISRRYYRQEYIKYLRRLCCACCCWKLFGTAQVDPSACDDLTQQPNHPTHEQSQENPEALCRNLVALATVRRPCDVNTEETSEVELTPTAAQKSKNSAIELGEPKEE